MIGETRLGTWCRRIEAALAAAAGAPGRIGPADFPTVLEWIRDDVPLGVVERAIDETARRQRGRGQQVRIHVAYLDADVRRAWRALRRRLGPSGGGAQREPARPREVDVDAERRNRIVTLRLAIDRHGDRAGAAELAAWREELAGLEAGE